jgi:cytosine deaminase
MAVHVCQMTGMAEIEACYNMITWNGAKTLSLAEEYGVEVGQPASFIILNADNRFEAIRKRSTVQYVFSQGKLLVETEPEKTIFHATS